MKTILENKTKNLKITRFTKLNLRTSKVEKRTDFEPDQTPLRFRRMETQIKPPEKKGFGKGD
jgi:hypothetical protein